MVSTAAIESKRAHPLLGEHGYDSKDPRMLALFVAHGPSFKQHVTVPVFDNVNVYGLLARVMGIQPVPNAGNPTVVPGSVFACSSRPRVPCVGGQERWLACCGW